MTREQLEQDQSRMANAAHIKRAHTDPDKPLSDWQALDPVVDIHHGCGTLVVHQFLPAGHEASAHTHEYAHLAIVASGRVVIVIDDEEEADAVDAPAVVKIEANKQHHFYALEDTTWFCVHATDGPIDPDTATFIANWDRQIVEHDE